MPISLRRAREDVEDCMRMWNTACTLGGSVCGSQFVAMVSAILLFLPALATHADVAIGNILPAPAPQAIMWITFVVTCLLFCGISDRCTGIMLAYIVYGVGLLLVTLITAICVQAQIDDYSSKFVSKHPSACIYVFIGCALYALNLYMVYRAYTRVRTANASGECEDLPI